MTSSSAQQYPTPLRASFWRAWQWSKDTNPPESLYINNAYGEGLANQFTETFTSLGGTVTASVPHEETQPTYTSELERATAGNPDVLISISYPGQAEVYLLQGPGGRIR